MKNIEENTIYTSPRREKFNEKNVSARAFVIVLVFFAVAGFSYWAGTAHEYIVASIKGSLGKEIKIDTSSLQSTYSAIRDNFDGEIDQQLLIDGANKGMVEALGDDYTNFLTSIESDEFNKSLSGDIGGGIGVEIGVRNDQPTVLRVLRDNPGEKAGVQVGDVFMEVNGESVEGKNSSEVASKVRGEEGTTVKVKFYRSGSQVEISMTREIVNNPSVYGSVSDGIGIITVTRFDNDTGTLARNLARQYVESGVNGVVLDLRGNGGGYVSAAKQLSGLWLDDEVVVIEKAGGKVVQEVRSGGSAVLEGMPTVVLVNQSSASASEIVAGALRDHNKAILVGETTFGKGSVQRLIDLPEGATLKVTVARWYTPAGLNISEKGITPDRVVVRTVEDINANRDPQLDAAKASLK